MSKQVSHAAAGLCVLVSICGMALSYGQAAGASDVQSDNRANFLSTWVEPQPGDLYHPQHVFVRFRAGATPQEVAAAKAKAGVEGVVYTYDIVPGLSLLKVPAGQEENAIAVLSAEPSVLYAERDSYVRALAQETPYGINSVRAPQAWPTSRGDGAIVAVLDTGFAIGHPDLPTPVMMESFIAGQTVQDVNTHGTHCSGTVLALDNDIGVIGVAPEAQLMIGKVLGDSGSGSDGSVGAGVNWATINGAHVISLSLGGGGFTQAMQDLYYAANEADVLVVAAAGNANSSNLFYPAAYDTVFAVSAVDSNNVKASFSNYGVYVDIAAPGVSTLSTVPVASVTYGAINNEASILTGSGTGTATGNAVFCGLGGDLAEFPTEVLGNIAVIRRGGGFTFQAKALNAITSGAVGVVIVNNTGGGFAGTLNQNVGIPVFGVSQADGEALIAAGNVQVSMSPSGGFSYGYKSGTSMACPHVAGVAALLIGEFGADNVVAAQVRAAMTATALDLGDPERDDLYGAGLVQSDAAMLYLAELVNNRGCPADFDRNGGVDGADVEMFFTAWEGGEHEADVNYDGGIDGSDVSAFFDVWQRGGC